MELNPLDLSTEMADGIKLFAGRGELIGSLLCGSLIDGDGNLVGSMLSALTLRSEREGGAG